MAKATLFSTSRNFGLAILMTIALVTLQLRDYFALPSADLERPTLITEEWDNAQEIFRWSNLEAYTQLRWTNCFRVNQCTNLKVPLNYSEPDGPSASIAIIRYPSPYLVLNPRRYRGPIILNPGGPGGSGVDLVARVGYLISLIVGPQFDILSFDPRGVGFSTPQIKFFETSGEQALASQGGFRALNESEDAVPRSWARAQVLGKLAAARDNNTISHMTTDNVARDMLQIVLAHGQDKIRYWGFSYGTVLGATFASMFPNRIERLVLDGVVDPYDYYSTKWSTNLRDSEKTLQTFFDGCVDAGPSRCAFYAPTAARISERLDNLYASIQAQPVPVMGKTAYGIVDYTMLHTAVFLTMYNPYANFPLLAKALADLEAGDGNGFSSFLMQLNVKPDCPAEQFYQNAADAGTAIICTDGQKVRDSPEEFKLYYSTMLKQSRFAHWWANIRLVCSGWQVEVENRFTGPIVGNTSHPILFIGNTADPVTSIYNAHETSKGFPGSVVLTQDSPGHCSTSGVSLCTFKYVHKYFQDGTLPQPGTICDVDTKLFPIGAGQWQDRLRELNPNDRRLLEAVSELSRTFWARLPL